MNTETNPSNTLSNADPDPDSHLVASHQTTSPQAPPIITTIATTPLSLSTPSELFLPTEIWGQVFEKIQKPCDLLNVVLACREFYDAGIRPLYRRVYYSHPLKYVANRPFWTRRLQGRVGLSGRSGGVDEEGTIAHHRDVTGFPLVPRSLVLGISWMNNALFSRYDPSVAVVEADGDVSFSQITPGAVPASGNAQALPSHLLYGASSSSVYHSYPSYAPSSASSSPTTSASSSPPSPSAYTSDFYVSRQLHYFASDALYDSITSHVTQFTMLTELIFHNAHLPLSVYTMIKCFPALENLFFYDCFLPLRYSLSMAGHHLVGPNHNAGPYGGPDDDHQTTPNVNIPGAPPPVPEGLDPLSVLPTAPIRRLAIWNVRNEADHMPHAISSFRYIFRLVRIPSLRVLHIDWTCESAVFLRGLMVRESNPGASPTNSAGGGGGCRFPPGITELAIRMPPQYAWPADVTVARTRLIDPLVAFLSHPSLQAVTCLEIVNRLPGCPIPVGALPNLSIYSGPHTSVLDIARYRNLAHVEFKDEDKKTLDVITMLPDLKQVAPGLRSLSVPLRKWDEEILYPTTGFWPELRKLKITYEEDHPSEYTILSLGARFLLNLPHLHTFQLYNPLYSSTGFPMSFKQAHFSVVGASSSAFSSISHPASTNFEELAFPPSPTLHVSHRLVKSQPLARRWHSGSSQLHLNTLPGHPLYHHGLHHHQQHQYIHPNIGHHGHHGYHHYTHHTHNNTNTALNASLNPILLTTSSSSSSSPSASTSRSSSTSSSCSGLYPPSSSLGPQAGPLSEVKSYLAAWRKHCKSLRRVQFVKDLAWRRWDEDMPWVPVEVDEENTIRLVDYGCE